jgi:hypothetical protein
LTATLSSCWWFQKEEQEQSNAQEDAAMATPMMPQSQRPLMMNLIGSWLKNLVANWRPCVSTREFSFVSAKTGFCNMVTIGHT